MNHRWWYRAARPNAGVRVEALSLEPMILLAVSQKVDEVDRLCASQKFYDPLWQHNDPRIQVPHQYKSWIPTNILRGTATYAAMRNVHLLFGLMTGLSRYSLSSKNSAFEKIRVEALVSPRHQ